MIKKGFHTGVVAFLMATANLAWASSGTELEGVRVAATPNGTQVILDLSGLTTEKVFTLENPDRAVIDLGNTRLAGGVRLPLGAGAVSGFRVGTQPAGTLRVVMQLRSTTPTHSAWLQSSGAGTRQLVITLGDVPTPAAMASTSAASSPPVTAAAPVATSAAMASTSDAVDMTPKIVRAAHAPTDSGRDIVVAVDAGHGGQDPGAIGHGGTREKDVTLAIARALAERINSEPGMRAC